MEKPLLYFVQQFVKDAEQRLNTLVTIFGKKLDIVDGRKYYLIKGEPYNLIESEQSEIGRRYVFARIDKETGDIFSQAGKKPITNVKNYDDKIFRNINFGVGRCRR